MSATIAEQSVYTLEIVKEEMAAAMEASKHFTTSLHPWIFKLEVSNHNYRKSS